MEFKFGINDIFKTPIVEINNSLLPPGFIGVDKRTFWNAVGKVSEVIDAMGEASAAAQGLPKPITTAERLRNSDHTIYLLVDKTAGNGRGAVTGMLKVGKKGLYVFDRNGHHYQVSPPCVLDFYVHESRQRTGLGKRLFQHMLQTENIEPVKMAIDRPSEKLLGFLNKHYTLKDPVKQMNNYVVFEGFFPSNSEENGTVEDHSGGSPGKIQSANGLQTTSYTSPWGRYGARKPPCSMGQIIHNQTSTIPNNTEPTGVISVRSAPETNYQNITGNSPGNPMNVTQSTPNMYYRPPEQQQNTQTIQNQQYQMAQNPRDLKYYQQQQSNNVWQSLGSTPPDLSNDQDKINFNRQIANYHEPYNGNQQTRSMYGNNQQMKNVGQQNYINQSGEEVRQQPPVIEGNGQTMYQSTPQYIITPNTQDYMPQTQNVQYPPQNITNPASAVQNMQGNGLTPNPPQYITNPASAVQNMQGNGLTQNNPSQIEINGCNQNHPQHVVPQVQGNVINTNQPQQTTLENSEQSQYNMNVHNLQNDPLLPQQNMTYLQNGSQVATNVNVPQDYQAVPQQNVVGYGLLPPPASSYLLPSYSTPQTAIQSIQSMSNASVQHSAAQSISQNNNQMVSNQRQGTYNVRQQASQLNVVPNTNVFQQTKTLPYNMTQQVSQTNMVPHPNNHIQNRMPYTMSNQASPKVVPATNILGQPINLPPSNVSASDIINERCSQPQNITTHVPNTLSQPNTNMVQTQNMTPRTAISQQYVNSAQIAQSQMNVSNQNTVTPEIKQHMEGSMLRNANTNQETLPIHDAKGDMRTNEEDLMFKYGYPPQVPDVSKRQDRPCFATANSV